ncbi:MAG: N-acetylmuramoyl-L-alanine amidase [Breznakibacter sp.]
MVYRIVYYLICLCLFALSASYTVAQNSIALKTVVIDAGHGGKDPGAVGAKVKEKDITLSVALKLGNYIKENFSDVKVVYTRSKDVFVPLDERAKIANKANADVFMSIHANWISKPSIDGTETFVLGLHRTQDNLEVAKKENAVIVLEENYNAKYEGFDPNSAESYIIFELMQNAYLDQSIQFASLIENQFTQRANRTSRGVKQAGFLVLRQTAMPSVLVELGFLTNKEEEQFLASENGQDILASALFRAFREYKHSFDAKSNLVLNGNPSVKKDNGPDSVLRPPGNTADKEMQSDITLSAKRDQMPINVVFRVQIATNAVPLSGNQSPLSTFTDTWMYKDKGMYKYTTGKSDSFAEIRRVLADAKKMVPDAFIVAFEDDNRIPIDEALSKLGQTR